MNGIDHGIVKPGADLASLVLALVSTQILMGKLIAQHLPNLPAPKRQELLTKLEESWLQMQEVRNVTERPSQSGW